MSEELERLKQTTEEAYVRFVQGPTNSSAEALRAQPWHQELVRRQERLREHYAGPMRRLFELAYGSVEQQLADLEAVPLTFRRRQLVTTSFAPRPFPAVEVWSEACVARPGNTVVTQQVTGGARTTLEVRFTESRPGLPDRYRMARW